MSEDKTIKFPGNAASEGCRLPNRENFFRGNPVIHRRYFCVEDSMSGELPEQNA